VVVGFALETEDLLKNGRSKLERKSLDMIVANDALEEGAGFGGVTNRVTILSRDGAVDELPLMRKSEVADSILDRVEALLNGRKE
jgi:phosphopantothenoylcysteine decarboxylase/phosphopantothenate--cysteine ligase